VRAARAVFHGDHVAFRDHILDHVVAVGEGGAQPRPGAGEALIAGIDVEVLHANAHALEVRSDVAHHRVLLLGAHRVLEAPDHRLVALDLRGGCLRGRPVRVPCGEREPRASAERPIDQSATREHGRCPPNMIAMFPGDS
jgi:hypothetical protein